MRVRPWLAGLVLVALSSALPAQDGPGRVVVQRLHQALEDNMRAGGTRDFAARKERLEPVIADVFDFDTISRVALGRHWEALDAEQRATVRALMQRISIARYAENFDAAPHGEHFVLLEERSARRGRVLVRSHLAREGDSPITLDYLLHVSDGGYRIINVLAEGVSDLSLKRAQYAAVIRDHGVVELLRRLRVQLEELERGEAPRS